jgi:hypothetical protein
MKEYKNGINEITKEKVKNLNLIRQDLIELVNRETDNTNLITKIIEIGNSELSQADILTFLVNINANLQTDTKSLKEVITKLINIKVDELIKINYEISQLQVNTTQNTSDLVTIPVIGQVGIKSIVFSFMAIFIFIFVLFKIDSSTTEKVINTMKNLEVSHENNKSN